jgi:hypothetical protein
MCVKKEKIFIARLEDFQDFMYCEKIDVFAVIGE